MLLPGHCPGFLSAIVVHDLIDTLPQRGAFSCSYHSIGIECALKSKPAVHGADP